MLLERGIGLFTTEIVREGPFGLTTVGASAGTELAAHGYPFGRRHPWFEEEPATDAVSDIMGTLGAGQISREQNWRRTSCQSKMKKTQDPDTNHVNPRTITFR